MDGYQEALKLLPPEIVGVFRAYHGQAEELRLRRGQAPHVYDGCSELALDHVPLTELDLRRVLERATGASLHTAATALRRGYICSRGLRIGVCGSAIIRGGEMEGFREFSSIAIRIPRECRGICADAVDTLCGRQRFGCIILGAPGSGKTTARRDMIRLFSERGYRVGVADERGEISGDGEFDLGPCSDVITGLSKAESAMLLLRGMNPQIIAMDEITQSADADAIRELCCCGVELLATAHARNADELRQRRVFAELLDTGAFTYALSIRGAGSARSYELEGLYV